MNATTGTRGRRSQEKTQDVSPISIKGVDVVPTIISSDMLDHGLNNGDDIYVWANRQSSQDISGKLRTGFTFVKYDDAKSLFKDQGRQMIMYSQDENGNLLYGSELLLMQGSKRVQNELIRRALNEQVSTLTDASVGELGANIDDLLHKTPVRRGQRVTVSTDEDHGSSQTITLDHKE